MKPENTSSRSKDNVLPEHWDILEHLNLEIETLTGHISIDK